MLFWESTSYICWKMLSRTSWRVMSSTYCFRAMEGTRPWAQMAQSGWARYKSLSGLIISGSYQMPNWIPRSFTR